MRLPGSRVERGRLVEVVGGCGVPEDLPVTESPSLVELMRMTPEEWDRGTRGSAIRRAGYAGFTRPAG